MGRVISQQSDATKNSGVTSGIGVFSTAVQTDKTLSIVSGNYALVWASGIWTGTEVGSRIEIIIDDGNGNIVSASAMRDSLVTRNRNQPWSIIASIPRNLHGPAPASIRPRVMFRNLTASGTITISRMQITCTATAVESGGAESLLDLTDVTAKTGMPSTIVVMNNSPVLIQPQIADFSSAQHPHNNAAGGGLLSFTSSLSNTPAAFVGAGSIYRVNDGATAVIEESRFTFNTLGNVTHAPTAAAAGTPTLGTVTGPAHTGMTASVEASDIIWNLARTVQYNTGPLVAHRAVRILAPTIAFVGASVVDDSATLYVSGAPIAGPNATLTRRYAFWADLGITRLDEELLVGTAVIVDAGFVEIERNANSQLRVVARNTFDGTAAIAEFRAVGISATHLCRIGTLAPNITPAVGFLGGESYLTDGDSNIGINIRGRNAYVRIQVNTTTEVGRFNSTGGDHGSLILGTATGTASATLVVQDSVADNIMVRFRGDSATINLFSSPVDGFSASLQFKPIYRAGSAEVLGRHNYINMLSPTNAGNVTFTDACVFRFPAAPGTHKAVDVGTTKTTPGGVDAWVKDNINGVIYYGPRYLSKTA